jgi:hypothetical protein
MADIYPPSKQRLALLALAAALNSSVACLRRDECGDWRIEGRSGHVYAVLGILWIEPVRPGFQFWCSTSSARAWSAAKKALAFAVVTQDGDDEGMAFLDRLPTAAEAEAIRRYVGIRKRRDISGDQLAVLRERARLIGGSRREKLPAAVSDGAMEPTSPPEPETVL